MQGAGSQVYAKALVAGVEVGSNTVEVAGVGIVEIFDGYPVANASAEQDIVDMIQLDGSLIVEGSGNLVHIGYDRDDPGNNAVTDDNCYVTYNQASPLSPVITKDGC